MTKHKRPKQLAIIGSTASGKTSLAIKVAKQLDAYILSLDSLSIYKEIDIVSAKPSMKERDGVVHFGIDYLYPNELFDVTTFIDLYKEVVAQCKKDNKALVIVGGTSFYLKMLIEGVSALPKISNETKEKTKKAMLDLPKVHADLKQIDPKYMSKIKLNDSYRIEKALHIFLETGKTPSEYFKMHPQLTATTSNLSIYQIEWDRDILRSRIALRTQLMLENGLIDEVCNLEKKYGRAPNCMKAIGIKETLAYLDGQYSKNEMIEKITTNTSRLAKRQKTFNNSQFESVIKGSVEDLKKKILL